MLMGLIWGLYTKTNDEAKNSLSLLERQGEGLWICKDLRPSPARLIRRGFAAPKRADLSQGERSQKLTFSAN
jgi:hypothetical protein